VDLRNPLYRVLMAGAVIASAVLAPAANAAATPSGKDALGFRLLTLERTTVRWGTDGQSPTTVTYAFADRPIAIRGAHNCKAMAPMDGLLESSGISQSMLRREARAAFDMWEQAANIRFHEIADVATAGIVIGVQEHPDGRAFADVMPRPDHPGQIEKALICLNPHQPWKAGFNGNLGVYDLRYTIAHEIGHAIGLDHPGPSGQVMSYGYHEEFRTLQAGDIDGAAALYGTSVRTKAIS
jgi:Matrixin